MVSKKTYLVALLQKHLIVFTQSDTENDRRNIFETVYPLFALTALAAYVEHAMNQVNGNETTLHVD